MPVTKQAKKALRRDKRRTKINKKIKSKLGDALRVAKKTLKVKDLKLAYSLLDKAAKKKVIHKRKAARLKSRLAGLKSRLAKKVLAQANEK